MTDSPLYQVTSVPSQGVGVQVEQQPPKTPVDLINWTLNSRQLCDLELILVGGFVPLTGFMGRADYEQCVEHMRLADGSLWPIPITLDVPRDFADKIKIGEYIGLRDSEGLLLALMSITDIWEPDKQIEAQHVFQSQDFSHPGVAYLMQQTEAVYVGGRVFGIQSPVHYDHAHLRYTPDELKQRFNRMGWERVVAFQTRNPMHRAHQELTLRAASQADAKILIHPVVGMTKPGDIDHYTRVRCYEKLLKYYPSKTAFLSLLPLAMRMAGPREALWHAIIRKNYGCTHLIVGRDHAGPGKDLSGKPYYGFYDAQALVKAHQEEIGIAMVPFQEVVYLKKARKYKPVDELAAGEEVSKISGTEFRRRLRVGEDIPEWFSYPDVIEELRKTHPPKSKQGVVIFFTGLSGSGKSTLANALMVRLLAHGGRAVTLLDGDLVRRHLSSELGFSKEHRDLNIQRIAFVASEIAKAGGLAICAPIAPYRVARRFAREVVGNTVGFVEVYLSTPLSICEERDRKGLYKQARAGNIKGFTGISDPYEIPEQAELVIDTSKKTPEDCLAEIWDYLLEAGYHAERR